MTITLATLAKATPQEVFDQVATHLLKQNQKAVFEAFSMCRYRAGNLMCAAGCLISDDEYRPTLEVGEGGAGWSVLVSNGTVPKAHSLLIQGLQTVHDGYPVAEWRTKLERLALKNGLVWNH